MPVVCQNINKLEKRGITVHIVKDENGNICPHGHENDHAHTHGHPHEGECKSCGGCGQPVNQNEALLTYMLQHNQSHAAELDQMAEKLRGAGMAEAAEQLKKAVDEFQKGNLYLGVALAMVKEQQ